MDDPRRILLVRPSALGDVCRTVPVLASLRAAFPDATVDWVVQDSFLPAIAHHPDLSEAIPFPRKRFAAIWRNPAAMGEFWRWTRAVRSRRYDLVIDCQGLGRSGFITLASAAPRRVGFRDAREFGWIGYTTRHDVPDTRCAVDRMLALLDAEEIPVRRDLRLYAAPEDLEWRAETPGLRTVDGPYAVLAPTARWAGKRWPAERWALLAEPLLARGVEHLVVIGAPGERDQAAACLPSGPSATRIVDLVGRTTVGQTMAVIAGADLVVANDSAPIHMAAGFDRPLVGLYGPTEAALVGPYGRDDWVLQAPRRPEERDVSFKDDRAGDAIIRRISMAAVLGMVDRVLAEHPVPGTAPVARETATSAPPEHA